MLLNQHRALARKDELIEELTKVAASKDVATYSALMGEEQPVVYVPKDDESEADQWERLNEGKVTDDDYADDLRNLGFAT